MKYRNLLIFFLIPLFSQISFPLSIFAMEDNKFLTIEEVENVIKSINSPLAEPIAERLFPGFEKYINAFNDFLDITTEVIRSDPQYESLKKEDTLVGFVSRYLNEADSLDEYYQNLQYKEDHIKFIKINFVLKMLHFLTLATFISISSGINFSIWGENGDVYCSTKSYEECHYFDEKHYDVNLYKIHLMPKEINYEKFWIRFLSDIFNNNNKDILSKILMVKAKVAPESLCKNSGAPKIVIYIPGGKEDAQYVLDKIYELYHSEKGCGYIPSFNEKVTDFISFAQGNRDQKFKELEKDYPEDQKHFELPEMIYFKADFDGTSFGNPPKDYKLKNPAKHSQPDTSRIQPDTSRIEGTSRHRSASF